jgi:hypothetical protein
MQTRTVAQIRFLNLGLEVDVLFVGFAMPAGLNRYHDKDHLHFVTFSCYRGLAGGTSLTRREILTLSFSVGYPILAGLVFARVGLSFSYFFFPRFSSTTLSVG